MNKQGQAMLRRCRKGAWSLGLAVGLNVGGAGCSCQESAQSAPLNVLAASSIEPALTELGSILPTGAARVSPRSSGELTRLLESGAIVDLVVTADESWMARLQREGLVRPETVMLIAEADLWVVQPVGAPLFHDLPSLAGCRRVALADPATAPAGLRARELLQRAGVWQAWHEKWVLAASSQAVATLVRRAEVDAGFVLGKPLAEDADLRAAFAAPQAWCPPARFHAAVTCVSPRPELAIAWIKQLRGTAAVAVFSQYGFTAVALPPTEAAHD